VAPDVETKRIVLFTLPPVREMDLVGAVDVFTSANRAVGGQPLYDVKVVSAEKARVDRRIDRMCGLSLQCDDDFHRFRGQIDTLLVPGGVGVEQREPEEAALKWLQKTVIDVHRAGSICAGSFLLAQAGLLDGRRTTTHWAFAPRIGEALSEGK
jgi:transcriptional regulator GlxA family with amidase domain